MYFQIEIQAKEIFLLADFCKSQLEKKMLKIKLDFELLTWFDIVKVDHPRCVKIGDKAQIEGTCTCQYTGLNKHTNKTIRINL